MADTATPDTATTDTAADTAGLLGRIPGGGSGFFDSVRFQLSIDPGLDANFVNFDLAFGTNELGATTDRVGIFLDGILYGLPPTWTLDAFHPFVAPAGSGFGFAYNLYPGGDVTQFPSLRVSLAIPNPASLLTLDFVLADVVDGTVDLDPEAGVGGPGVEQAGDQAGHVLVVVNAVLKDVLRRNRLPGSARKACGELVGPAHGERIAQGALQLDQRAVVLPEIRVLQRLQFAGHPPKPGRVQGFQAAREPDFH